MIKENKSLNYKEELYELLKNHPIITINCFIVIGGFFNLLYFFKIGYLPMLKTEDALFLFLISGLVGLIFILLILSYLVFPALNYKSYKPKVLKNITYTHHKKIDIKLKFRLFLFPIFLYITYTIGLISFYKPNSDININLFILWLSLNFLTIFLAYRFHIIKDKIASSFKQFVNYFLIISASFLFMFVSFIITSAILNNSTEIKSNLLIYSISLGLFTFTFLSITIFNTNYLKQVFISLGLLFMLLFITKTYHVIPYSIMKTFDLGQIYISLQVNKKSCKLIINKEIEKCYIPRAFLLWRSGKNFIIEKDVKITKNKIEKIRYIIPYSSVEGWSIKNNDTSNNETKED